MILRRRGDRLLVAVGDRPARPEPMGANRSAGVGALGVGGQHGSVLLDDALGTVAGVVGGANEGPRGRGSMGLVTVELVSPHAWLPGRTSEKAGVGQLASDIIRNVEAGEDGGVVTVVRSPDDVDCFASYVSPRRAIYIC